MKSNNETGLFLNKIHRIGTKCKKIVGRSTPKLSIFVVTFPAFTKTVHETIFKTECNVYHYGELQYSATAWGSKLITLGRGRESLSAVNLLKC